MGKWWSEQGERCAKYALLFVALSITIQIVFSGFSNYLSRRAFETDLEGKNAPNFEVLEFMSRRERAIAVATRETRCTERNEIALFRLLDANLRQKLNDAYFRSRELRSGVAVALNKITTEHKEWADVVDIDDLKTKIAPTGSTISTIENLLKPKPPATADDPRFREYAEAVTKFIMDETAGYLARLTEYDNLRVEAEKQLGKNNVYFRNIQLLEARLDSLRKQRVQNRESLGIAADPKAAPGAAALGDVLARYTAWKEAQLGAVGDNPVLDELAVDPNSTQSVPLWNLDCDRFERFVETAGDRSLFRSLHPAATSFTMPLIAQTLFVTLFLGAMGALTINVLRLSKIGWWREQQEPAWGELLLSPFVGALAAFCIFLLGSTGLLLTSDVKAGQSGVTSLSAFFIGLLGFVSGLLYDEAFGRVRRFGAQLFGADDPTVVASPEDRSLAEALRAAKASYVAELVLKFGIGKRIASEPEFTLLVPADEAMSRLTLQAWKEISEPITRSKFETWFRRHHATRTVNKSDVASGAATEIETEADAKYPLEIADDDLLVNKIKAVQAGVAWGNGVIHVLEEDVP
jgi:hypothetical protein